jgi:hypothetical protein
MDENLRAQVLKSSTPAAFTKRLLARAGGDAIKASQMRLQLDQDIIASEGIALYTHGQPATASQSHPRSPGGVPQPEPAS